MRITTLEEFKKAVELQEKQAPIQCVKFFRSDALNIEKAGKDKEGKQVKGSLSSLNNEDSYGDVMMEGCFEQTMRDLNKFGVPMLWGHSKLDIVGNWYKVWMKNNLLMGEGNLFVDNIARAAECDFMYQKGIVKGISIGFSSNSYKIVDEYKEGDWTGWHYEFYNIDIYEASLTPWPANEQAQINNIKQEDFVKNTIERVKEELNLNFTVDRPQDIVTFLSKYGLTEPQAKALVNTENYTKNISLQKMADAIRVDNVPSFLR